MTTVRLSEVFGPTFQGEGPSTGQRAMFVRLAGCNLDCSWCDTPYTWDWRGKNGFAYDPATEVQTVDVEQVVATIHNLGRPGDLVVLTGGEPTIQSGAITALCEALAGDYRIEIETNGTLQPPPGLYRANVSPKLGSSEVGPKAERPAAIAAWAARAGTAWKFVAQGPTDLAAIADYVEAHHLEPRAVWVMPEGRDAGTILSRTQLLADLVLPLGFNLSTRLHVLTWGDTRAK